MFLRILVLLAILTSAMLLANCAGAIPGWSRDGIDRITTPDGDSTDEDDNGVTPAPGADTDDNGSDDPSPPPSAGGDDLDGGDDDPPAAPGGGGGEITDVLDIIEYDVAHRVVKLSINPVQAADIQLVMDYPQGLESMPGKESVIPAGTAEVDVVFEFTADAMLDAEVTFLAYDQQESSEIGWEYAIVERPLAITDFNYEPAYDRLRGWVNISGESTITIEVPPGVNLGGVAEVTVDESCFFEFPVTLDDDFVSGTAYAHATDVYGNTHTHSAQLAAAGAYQDDTLYIYAPEPQAHVNEPVTVVVATGRPAHPLQFLSCVSVTIDDGGVYVPDSFSIGEPGGGRLGVDGLWSQMGVPEAGFLDLGDAFMPGAGVDIGQGRHEYQFAIVTMGPYPAADDAGVLFSFQLSFDQPGEYSLGLRKMNGDIGMTYYADEEGLNYYWGTLMADRDGNMSAELAGYDNLIIIE